MTDASRSRPWGSYQIVDSGSGYQLKILTIAPQSSLSLQYHRHRSEHWVVISGEGHAIVGDSGKQMKLEEGSHTVIQKGEIHRLTNKSQRDLVVAEIQLGEYISEDDIVRLEDEYGRV